jgi:hypothetical protein
MEDEELKDYKTGINLGIPKVDRKGVIPAAAAFQVEGSVWRAKTPRAKTGDLCGKFPVTLDLTRDA